MSTFTGLVHHGFTLSGRPSLLAFTPCMLVLNHLVRFYGEHDSFMSYFNRCLNHFKWAIQANVNVHILKPAGMVDIQEVHGLVPGLARVDSGDPLYQVTVDHR